MNAPNPSPLQATSPLLSVDQVAGELGVQPLAVRRLIAFGALKANRLGDTGEWKVLPDALQKYVTDGAPLLKMPDVQGGWFKDNPLRAAAEAFANEVRAILDPFLPQQAPEESYKPGTLELFPKEALELVRKQAALPPITFGVRLPNQPSAFPTRGAEYLASKLRDELKPLADPTVNEQMRSGATPLGKLYDGPERFQSLTQQARDRISQQRFAVHKDYPARRQFENAPRVWVVVKLGDVFSTVKLKEIVDAAL